MSYGLNFISDADLYAHVKQTIERYRFEINLNDFNNNLIDPIKLTFDSKVYDRDIGEVVEAEVIRQLDKSNTNHIGYFHQNIFNYIGGGAWVVPTQGYDIVNAPNNIYVEMKNKHNTMNSSSSKNTYIRMQNTLLQNPQATCMLVEVIARNSQNIPWSTSIDGTRVSNDKIRRVSIDKFYELVSGESDAFKKLCEKIPTVIDDVIRNITLNEEANTVLEELRDLSPNILKSLYLFSFEKYEGFDNFNV